MFNEKSLANLKPAKKGEIRNPKGRPKGKTLKEYAREYLLSLDEEEKKKFLKKVGSDMVWRMAEGNPHQSSDVEVKVPQSLIELLHGNKTGTDREVAQ